MATVHNSIHTERYRTWEWIALLLIVFMAAILRLGMPGVVEFKRDEANLSELALDMVRGGGIPVLGIDSSVGIRNAPINVYIMAVPYLFTSDPVVATQYVALLNVVGVALAFALTRRYYGALAAIIAGVAFAISPWAVVYSRKIWAQDLLPPFILLSIGTALLGFLEGRRWAQFLHLPLLAITGQIHYVAFVLIPITLYLLIVGRKNLRREFLFSVIAVGLVILPYAIGMAGLLSDGGLRRPGTLGSAPIALTGDAITYAAFTITGTNLHAITGPERFRQFLDSLPAAYPIFDLLGFAVAIAAVWLVVRLFRVRDARTPVDVTLLLWLVVTPLSFSVTWTAVYPHYMIPILPAAYMILGVGVSDLFRALPKPTARLVLAGAGVAFAGIMALQVLFSFALLNFVNTYPTPGGFGVPLGLVMPLREQVLAAQPQQVIGQLDGQWIGYNEDTTVWNFLLKDIPLVRFTDPDMEVVPRDEALKLRLTCDAPEMRGRNCYEISPISATPIDPVNVPPFANGAQIVAYEWLPDSKCIDLTWRIADSVQPDPTRADYNFAVHFYNADGQKLLDADGLAWRGRYWRAGDTVTSRRCLAHGHELIPQLTQARIGMYTFEDKPEGRVFFGVDLIDVDGQPFPAWIALNLSDISDPSETRAEVIR